MFFMANKEFQNTTKNFAVKIFPFLMNIEKKQRNRCN